jgi:ADP-heptose:LPS heptosyltransferase
VRRPGRPTETTSRRRGTDRPVVLTLRALGIGDLLTGVPALRGIADHHPEAHRVLAAPGWLRPLVELTGAIDEVVDVRPFDPNPLTPYRPSLAVNLHGRGPASHRMLVATRPARLVAFQHPEITASVGSPRWEEEEHEVERWCRLLGEEGIPADARRLELAPPGSAPPGLAGVTVIHPGAASGARRWPPARWATVARAEAATGAHVVVTGSSDERSIACVVARLAGLPSSRVLAGRLDLADLASLVSSARIVMSGDTGVAHLSTAFRTPSVVLFGPTPPRRWGPPPDRPEHVVLWAGSAGDPHASAVDPALLRISVGDVLEAAHRARVASDPARRSDASWHPATPPIGPRARKVHA